jgi:hypothetical protein
MNPIIFSPDTVKVPFLKVRLKIYTLVLIFGVLGFVSPLLYGLANGFPAPDAHDEMSYLLAADTYASGRLTNPTPAQFESFETLHELMEPSYMSKYPPLQGAVLAVGQVLFGHAIFGVWLSCGLFASSLFWMLSAWTKPNWAIAGTLLMIFFIGINSYWAQSYWGGMVAASGGALFFGGFRRLFREISIGSTFWMTLGGIILVNSRPFEGVLTMLLPLTILLGWILKNNDKNFLKKVTKVVIPGFALAAIALSAMCYQNYRVTGSPLTMPYVLHQSQYYPANLFIFQDVNHSATKGNSRIRRYYDNYNSPPILVNFQKLSGFPNSVFLLPFYGLIYLLAAIPLFFFSPLFTLLLYAGIPFLAKRSKWLVVVAATILFTFICMSFATWWDAYHYSAPLTSCFFLLTIESCRQFYGSGKTAKARKFVAFTLIGLTVGSTVFLQLVICQTATPKPEFSADRALLLDRLSADKPVSIKIPFRATFFKHDLDEIVEKLPGRYIAIVTYDENYDYHDEVVFNKADIFNAKLIWAHDLGDDKNRSLLLFYPGRKVLRIKIGGMGIEIIPNPER